MNKEIDRLIAEATVKQQSYRIDIATSQSVPIDPPKFHKTFDRELFANLIIKQCISIVNTWSEEEPCSEGYDIMSVYRIKEYFGVKDDE